MALRAHRYVETGVALRRRDHAFGPMAVETVCVGGDRMRHGVRLTGARLPRWRYQITMAGASRPAYTHLVPWQALFEQKLVLDVPPGSLIVWHSAHVSLNW